MPGPCVNSEMDPARNKNTVKSLLMELGLLALGALLFALSFPSFLSLKGWYPLAYLALVPVFIVVHRCGWVKVFLYGPLYAFTTYALFNYWLSTFHPLAILIVPTIYAVYFLVLFPLLKLADTLFPRRGFLVQLLIWMGYEFLRTKGYLGYPYGIIGYTQYLFLPFIRIAEITGVWGISALVVFPSVYLGNALKKRFSLGALKEFAAAHRLSAAVYGALILLVLLYGFVRPRDYAQAPRVKVGLIQHNADTWEGGFRAYERNMNTLIRLSREARQADPGIEMMIWSETSFVPGIDWHTKYRNDPQRYRLVKELIEFFDSEGIPYVIGNDDGQLEPDGSGELARVDYNAVLLYDRGKLQDTYRKTHLVPFTEHFPYEETFPRFHQKLIDLDYRFWKKGTEYTVFEAVGFRFSTPICFEDVFGYLSRRFVNRGAQVIVNMTNDSWSGSSAAEMQHAAMAVFRAIENNRTVVRGTNSGITCTIEPDGEITAMLEPFTEGFLINEIPIYDETTTLYTRWGDWLAHLFLWSGLAALLFGIVRRLRRHGQN